MNVVRIHAGLYELVLHGLGASVSEDKVVLDGAAVVAVSFNHQLDFWVRGQELGVRLGILLLIGPNVGLVWRHGIARASFYRWKKIHTDASSRVLIWKPAAVVARRFPVDSFMPKA